MDFAPLPPKPNSNPNPATLALPKPEDRRARLVTMYEGKFLSVVDFREALKDDAFVIHCAEMLAVAVQAGESSVEGFRRSLGCAVATLAGDLPGAKPAAAKPATTFPKVIQGMHLHAMIVKLPPGQGGKLPPLQ